MTTNDCLGLEQRLDFAGDYPSHDCSIRVSDAASSDTGLWTCQLESYKFGGGRGSGTLLSKDIYVQVMPLTTTTPSPPPPTTTTARPTTKGPFISLDKMREDRSLPTIPKHSAFDVSLAKFVPYTVTIVVIVIFLVLFTVIVVLHKLKTSKQRQRNEVVNFQPKLEIPKTTDQNDLLFLKNAFPHVMRFPSDDLGLNL